MNKVKNVPTFKQLVEMFEQANTIFLAQDEQLIYDNVSERSWYTRFAIYLTNLINYINLDGYVVDSEYNRNGGKLKTVYDQDRYQEYSITCDLILHSRGMNREFDNLICIEMKKSTATEQSKLADKNRLKLLTSQSFDNIWPANGKALPKYVCGYLLGVYYEIDKIKRTIIIEYYRNGKKYQEKILNF